MDTHQKFSINNLNVLVVDDHMIMRNMISQNLRDIGFNHVELSSNGEDALEKINQRKIEDKPYHIVFLDWSMPILSGLEMLKTCRNDHPNTAFIMLTAKNEEKDVLTAIQNGATSYITKPTTKEELDKHVSKTIIWLEKQKNLSSDTEIKKKKSTTVKAKKMPLISQEICTKLEPVVMKEMKNIFSSLFNVTIIPDHHLKNITDKSMICIGRLHQKNTNVALSFIFQQDLLKPLLAQIYSEEYLKDNAVYEDAACEIVNILCNQVKGFLNKHGFALEFDLPYMDKKDKKSTQDNSVMNVSFSLRNNDEFYIDIKTD